MSELHQHALTPKEASRYLGISEAALRLWRGAGAGPAYFRAGERLIRYRRADLDAWIERRMGAHGGAHAVAAEVR